MVQEYSGEVVPLGGEGPAKARGAKEYTGEVVPVGGAAPKAKTTSAKDPGALSEFWSALTSESPKEIYEKWTTSEIGKGAGRQYEEAMDKRLPPEMRWGPAPPGMRRSTPEEFQQTFQHFQKLEPDKAVGEVLTQAKDYMVKHPGATVAEFAKGMTDPAMYLPFLGQAGTGAKLSALVERLGKTTQTAARLGGDMVEAGAKGATVGAASELAKQYAKGDYHPEEVAGSAAISGAMFSLLGVRRGDIPAKELESGKISDTTANEILERYQEKGGKAEDLTLDQVKQRAATELAEDKVLNARDKAHRLMQEGASKAKVEAIVKKNPLVGMEMAKIRARREDVKTSRLGVVLQGEVLDPAGALVPREEARSAAHEPEASKPAKPKAIPLAEGVEVTELHELPPEFKDLPSAKGRDPNASGESAASMEAQNRVRQEAAKGQERFVVNPDGSVRPLKGVDAVDTRAGKGQVILQRGVGKSEWTVLEQGEGTGKHSGPAAEERVKSFLRNNQGGKADPLLLAKVAAVGTGAFVAARMAQEDKIEAAIAGGIAGLALTQLPRYIDFIKRDWKSALGDTVAVGGVTVGASLLDKEHPVEGAMLGMLWGSTKMLPKAVIPKVGDMTIDDIINLRNGSIAAREREVSNLSWAIKTAVPDPLRREAVAVAVEKGDLRGLSPEERKAAEAYKGFTQSYGEAAKSAGVIEDMVGNYVTHIVEREGLPASTTPSILRQLFGGDETPMGGGASPKSSFARHRKYDTFEELQKALEGSGLRLKTKDVAEIAEIYGRSMGRAIENKRMLDSIGAAKEEVPGGTPYITTLDKAPPDYITINSPQMRGRAVHPDLAKPLQFVLESKSHNDIVNATLALAMAQKRIAVGFSLFHANNLFNAFVGATGRGPIFARRSINAALDTYRKGGAGDAIDLLIRNGLRVERPLEVDQNALGRIGGMADQAIEKVFGIRQSLGEKSLGAVEKIQTDVFDRLTWNYLHTGMKLAVGMREFERLRLEKPNFTKEEVARQVSSFVNDTFGGLDWYRVATETRSQMGRRVGLAALSPNGRIAMQIGMFAPDWTLSTFRAMYKALPGSTEMPLTQRLHQKYVLRTAIIYMTLMNAVNMQTSGHPIWDNKNPTRIEYKDGTSQQFAKHAMEGPEWLLHPRQTALNKLGPAIALPIELATGKSYLAAESSAPPIESRTSQVLKRVSPISVSSATGSNLPTGEAIKRGALGAAGFPVYGMTDEQKAAAREEKRAKKRKKMEEQQ
jgi:hypothetical protein